MVDRLP